MGPADANSDVTALDDAVIVDNYDAGAIDRGRGYAEEDRVKLMSVDPGSITAVVAGSGRNTYLVQVAWRTLGGDIIIDDRCSCPLGGFCKHAVATILTARTAAVHEPATTTEQPRPWRRVLAGLDAPEGGSVATYGDLALSFHVTLANASRYAPDPIPHLVARPLRRGKRDNWVKTGASWRDLYYAHGSSGFDPVQVAALKALWNASPRHSYYPDTGPLSIDRFGPEFWLYVRNAAAAGVALVVDSSNRPVILEDDLAVVEVDLTADVSGTVTLSADLMLDGKPAVPSHAVMGVLGTSAHGLFVAGDDGSIRLIQLEKSLDATMLRLLGADPLQIPAADVDELLDVYQPRLEQRAKVGSSDGSVVITSRHFDGVTLMIERHAVDVATTRWAARYVRGDKTTYHPIGQAGGSGRDRLAETTALAGLAVPLALAPLVPVRSTRPGDVTVRGAHTVELFSKLVPWIESRPGVTVHITNVGDVTLPELREAVTDPLVELAVSDPETTDGQTDWFDLAVTVTVDGEKIPFAALFTALARSETVLVLTSGTWLRLDREEFDRLRTLIEEARGLIDADAHADDDTIRINPFQISWFEELAALGVVTEQSEKWSANVARMEALSAPVPVEPPDTLKAELRPYQAEGLAWLDFIQANDLGGILADDMGLGKTVQILSVCAKILQDRPDARFLVVAPTSVVDNWRREAERFVPTVAVKTITETHKRRGTTITQAVEDASLVVTSYTLFRLEADEYSELSWDLMMLDEAQYVKNHQSKTYKAVRTLRARSKIAITGTPLENSLMDLWSLLSITAPGLYPDPARFSHVYRKPIEKGDAPALLATLRRRIAPLMRRRTKDAVLTELPPKIEQVVEVELGPKHRKLYQTHLQRERSKVLGLVEDMNQNRFTIFKSLTLLRQLSLDPGLVDETDDHIGSAKLDRLVEDVSQVAAEGHRALVFSQFTRFLRRAEARLNAAQITTVYLDGRTRKRDKVIDAFKSGDASVFLISLKAGGVGLNLAEADYCFILDPWWNPAAETQAVDRAHRIGQTNPVVVYRYVSAGTIEEKVMELKARKAALFADVVDAEGALAGALTAEDIRGLFDPG